MSLHNNVLARNHEEEASYQNNRKVQNFKKSTLKKNFTDILVQNIVS